MGESEIFFRPFHHPLLVIEFDSPHTYIGNSNVVDFGSHSVSVPRLRQFRLAGQALFCLPHNPLLTPLQDRLVVIVVASIRDNGRYLCGLAIIQN